MFTNVNLRFNNYLGLERGRLNVTSDEHKNRIDGDITWSVSCYVIRKLLHCAFVWLLHSYAYKAFAHTESNGGQSKAEETTPRILTYIAFRRIKHIAV